MWCQTSEEMASLEVVPVVPTQNRQRVLQCRTDGHTGRGRRIRSVLDVTCGVADLAFGLSLKIG